MDLTEISNKFNFSSEDSNLVSSVFKIALQQRDIQKFFEEDFFVSYAELAGVNGEIRDKLNTARRELFSVEINRALFKIYYYLWYRLQPALSVDQLPDISSNSNLDSSCFYFMLALAGFPETEKLYREHKYPEQILLDTLSDLGVWVDYYQAQSGITGIKPPILGWIKNHQRGEIFRLGRLQIKPLFKFSGNILVYRNIMSNEVVVLSDGDVRYNRQGLCEQPGDVGVWTSILKISDSEIAGNPVSADGYAQQQLVTLPFNEWHQELINGDAAIDIHIPAIGPLEPSACNDSIIQATQFMKDFFPDINYRTFVCTSWLLDNQFKSMLPDNSNIVRFQQPGYLYPVAGKSAAIVRIFGYDAESVPFGQLPCESSLQRAASSFLNNGGIFRNGGMFFLRSDLPWNSNPYHRQ
jgi:hypothetical protein